MSEPETSPRDTSMGIQEVTVTPCHNVPTKKRKHKKKKLLRPNSPAAYPLPLPIRNEYFEEKKHQAQLARNEQTTGLSSKEDESKIQSGKQNERMSDGKHMTNTDSSGSFQSFRIHYLIIHIAIMLADGLQGAHTSF